MVKPMVKPLVCVCETLRNVMFEPKVEIKPARLVVYDRNVRAD